MLRGKTLRCGGKGKYRHTCGISGIDLRNVTHQINELITAKITMIYRFQRVNGNQGELDELNAELSRVRQTLATPTTTTYSTGYATAAGFPRSNREFRANTRDSRDDGNGGDASGTVV